MKQKILILSAILFLCGIYSFSQTNSEVEPVQIVQDVNFNEYIPFSANSKVASLNGNSSHKLYENLPRLDGATALYPVYASFVQAVYPQSNYSSLYRGIVMCTQTNYNWK